MRIGNVHGMIDRRILLNYRVDSDVLAQLLPYPFRPKLIQGYGIAGICLIRLTAIRPKFAPACLGISSDNIAHRVAVEWNEGELVRSGVFVQRRDTNSWFNTVTGGRLFPGHHHHGVFRVQETNTNFALDIQSDDGAMKLALHGQIASHIPESSVFKSVEEASDFFQTGAIGFSPIPDSRRFDGLELRCLRWEMEPLAIQRVRSSFFDDERIFPPGSTQYDSAFLMRDIPHEWHAAACPCCTSSGGCQ